MDFKWLFYRRGNVTKKRPSVSNISSETIKVIEELNCLDIELYKYAEQLFQKQLEDNGLYSQELTNYRRANRFYQENNLFRSGVDKLKMLQRRGLAKTVSVATQKFSLIRTYY